MAELLGQGMITLFDFSDPIVGDNPPENPEEDMTWVCTKYNPPVMFIYKNGEWVEVGSSSPIPNDMNYGGFLSSSITVNTTDPSSLDLTTGYFSSTYVKKYAITANKKIPTPLNSTLGRSHFIIFTNGDDDFVYPTGLTVSHDFIIASRQNDGWHYYDGVNMDRTFTPKQTHCNVGRIMEYPGLSTKLGIETIIMYSENMETLFDLLTGEGSRQGLFTTENGKVYVNAEFIAALGLHVKNAATGETTLLVRPDSTIIMNPSKFILSTKSTSTGGNPSLDDWVTGEVNNASDRLQSQIDKTIIDIDDFYFQTTANSGVTGNEDGWVTTVPPWRQGYYIWSKTVTTYADKTTTVTTPVCISGTDGRGILGIIEYYYASVATDAPTGGNWITTVPPWSKGIYIWIKRKINYTDGTSETTDPVCVSGYQGSDGSDAKSLSLVSTSYAVPFTAANAPKDSSNITLTAYQQNFSDEISWSVVPSSVTLTGTGKTRTLAPTAFNNNNTIKIGITAGSFSDSITIVKVKDGSNGANGADGTDGAPGADGADAKILVLTSNRQAVAFDANNNPKDSTAITFTATLQNFSDTVTWETTDNIALGGAGNVRTLSISYLDNRNEVRVKASAGGLSDTVTIVKIKDGNNGTNGAPGSNGADAYTIVLSNESHTFAGDTSSALSASTTSSVIAYKGTTKVAATIGTITGMPAGMTTSISGNGTTSAAFTVNVIPTMTTKNGVLNVPITVDGKTFTKEFTYALALKGNAGEDGTDGIDGTNGADAYTILLTNESHTFVGDTNAALAGSASSGVIAYKGATKIPVTVGTITGMPTGMTTSISNNSSNEPTITITVTTAMTTKNGVLKVPITVDGKAFTKEFTYALALKGTNGATGSPGADAKSLSLLASKQTVAFDKNNNPKDNTAISLTALQQNYSDSVTWSTVPTVSLTGSGNTRQLAVSNFSPNNQIEITISSGGLTDKVTVAKVKDGDTGAPGTDGTNGTDGADAYTLILSNESHTFAGDTDSAVAGSTTTDIIAYKGTQRMSATIGTITGTPTGMTTAISNNGTTTARITISVTTAMVTKSGVLTIPLTIDGKSFTKQFTYSLALNGSNGISVTSTTVEYALSSSSTAAPTSGWTSGDVSPTESQPYIWSRVKTTLSNGNSNYSPAACIASQKVKITAEFAMNTSKTNPPTSGWSATQPLWVSGSFIWTRNKIEYTSPSKIEYTTPYCDSSWQAIDDIVIGGRNILLNSGNFKDTKNWISNAGSGLGVVNKDGFSCLTATGSYRQDQYILEPDSTYIYWCEIMFDMDVPVNSGTPLHCWLKQSSIGSDILASDPNGGTIEFIKGGGTISANTWRKLVIKLTTNSQIEGKQILFRPFIYKTSFTETWWLKYIKLEKGNKYTDWTPAPEDIDASIKEVSTALSNLDTAVKDAFGDGVVNDAEAKALAQHIKILDTEKADIDIEYTTVYNNTKLAGTAKTELASSKTAYDNAHTLLKSAINTAIADSKVTTGERTDVDNKLTTYRNSLSTYRKRVNEAQDFISTNKIDDLQIGNKNLVRNSGFVHGSIGGWMLRENVIIDTDRLFNGHPTLMTSQSGLASDQWKGGLQNITTRDESIYHEFDKDERITMSCWYYVEDKTTIDQGIALEFKGFPRTNPTGPAVIIGSYAISTSDVVVGKWTKIQKTVTVPEDMDRCYVNGWVRRNGTAWFADFMVKYGDKSGDWQASPYDALDYVDDAFIVDGNKYDEDGNLISTEKINIKESFADLIYTSEEMGQQISSIQTEFDADGSIGQLVTQVAKLLLTDEKLTAEFFKKVEDADGAATDVRNYFDFSGEGLIIGQDGYPVRLKLTKDRMSFIDETGKELAWFSNEKLMVKDIEVLDDIVVEKLQVNDTLKLGTTGFVKRPDGGMALSQMFESVTGTDS